MAIVDATARVHIFVNDREAAGFSQKSGKPRDAARAAMLPASIRAFLQIPARSRRPLVRKCDSRSGRRTPFRARTGTPAFAQTPVLPETDRAGALSAQLRRPRPWSGRHRQTSRMRKYRSFVDGVAKGANRNLSCSYGDNSICVDLFRPQGWPRIGSIIFCDNLRLLGRNERDPKARGDPGLGRRRI